MAVRFTATLRRLADQIAAGATSTAELAERTGTHPATLDRLPRHLVAIGVLAREGGQLSLTEVGEAMREGQSGNRGPPPMATSAPTRSTIRR
jgi:DNA-binding IclR family transcriptional regulator